ncbi:MAG: M56 family metallopeptidase, partial [Verrucomicrobiales bacterium]|nr:M56 family metallopeptidase [Verrucomicrobiales bacterium]
MNAPFETLALRLVAALGNGLLQGTLLALVVMAGCRWHRRSSAAGRYAVVFVALLTVAALPAVHFLAAAPPPAPTSTSEPATLLADANLDAAHTASSEASPPDLADTSIEVAEIDAEPGVRFEGTGLANDATIRSPGVEADVEDTRTDVPNGDTNPLGTVPPGWATAAAPPAFLSRPEAEPRNVADAPPRPTLSDWLRRQTDLPWPPMRELRLSVPGRIAEIVVVVWLALAALRLGALGWQCLSLRSLVRDARPAPAPIHRECLRLAGLMRLRRRVHVGVCPDLHSPVAVGFARPAILLPEALIQAPPESLSPLLRHELAHIARYDDWTNLVQQAVKAVFFFHPGVLALSRRLTLDREIACDDHVLKASKTPRDYALFLTDFASRTRGRRWAAAPAAWSNPSQLRERIHMILDSKRNISSRVTPTRIGVLTVAALIAAAVGIGATPRIALDATASEPPSAETTSPDVLALVDDSEDVFSEEHDLAAATTEEATEAAISLATSPVSTTGGDDDDSAVSRPKSKSLRSSGSSSANVLIRTDRPDVAELTTG